MKNDNTLVINALDTDFFNVHAKNYLADPAVFSHLLPAIPMIELLEKVKIDKNYNTANRSVLVEAIRNQYSRLKGIDLGEKLSSNLDKLANQNSVTITAGQQIHVALGPLFVFYKIWTCLDRCLKLQKEHPSFDFIPVFWMATEDHDFEEIRDVRLYNDVFTWQQNKTGAVGELNPSALVGLMDDVLERSDKNPGQVEFLEICKHAYGNYANFSDATRHILHAVFGESGLLILDPNDPTLKKLFTEDIIADVLDNSMLEGLKMNQQLMKANGINVPINGRDINHFYLIDGLRERIDMVDGKFQVLNSSIQFSKDTLLEEIELHPERFSPNALLRPLYQQRILPNVEYIGGGSELVYWMELSAIFRTQNVIFPHFQMRTSAFILNESTWRKLSDGMGEISHALKNDENLAKIILDKENDQRDIVKNKLATATKELESLKGILAKLPNNQSINRMVDKCKHGIEQLSEEIESGYVSSISNQEHVERMMKLKNKVFPKNKVQERTDSIVRFAQELLEYNKQDRPDFANAHNMHILLSIK